MTVTWTDYTVALFDLDGVITPTAELHMRAWAEMFSEFLDSRGIAEPYTDEDYFTYVDGKPRYDGVRSFLESRGIELPEGDPTDSPELETVCGLGNRKNIVFNTVLERDGITPYPGTLLLMDHLDGIGMPMAIVSSSKNARTVLTAAGLLERFPVIMDGAVAAAEGIPGKPAPDTFVAAAAAFGASPGSAVVIEDAHSGVAAGRAGGFALVIGVDRGAGAEALREAGADVVVTDLEELV
ncbi:MAG: HAD-IA family hydrolase [bacterium]|nr:HAD-IA family hydrolase [bacterium]